MGLEGACLLLEFGVGDGADGRLLGNEPCGEVISPCADTKFTLGLPPLLVAPLSLSLLDLVVGGGCGLLRLPDILD